MYFIWVVVVLIVALALSFLFGLSLHDQDPS